MILKEKKNCAAALLRKKKEKKILHASDASSLDSEISDIFYFYIGFQIRLSNVFL